MTDLSVILLAHTDEESTEACIESFLYGNTAVSEILLVTEDSPLCHRYSQVRCVSNMALALESAGRTWICFASGQDRVHGDFVASLLHCAGKYPNTLPLCSIRNGNNAVAWDDTLVIESTQLPKELLHPIYNKLFRRDILITHKLCPHGLSDHTFVEEYLRLSKLTQCVVEKRPLYLKTVISTDPVTRMALIKSKLVRTKNGHIIKAAAKRLRNKTLPLTILSQNCVGGFLYRDMGQPYRSPTAGLFFRGSDFLRFVLDLDRYLAIEPVMRWGDDYPIGTLGEIEIHFLHYHTCREAKEKWLRRCSRMIRDKIMVICTDRDGFTDADFALWQTVPYPKVLITARDRYRHHPDTLYLPEFRRQDRVGDLFTARKFYHGHKLIDTINEVLL